MLLSLYIQPELLAQAPAQAPPMPLKPDACRKWSAAGAATSSPRTRARSKPPTPCGAGVSERWAG